MIFYTDMVATIASSTSCDHLHMAAISEHRNGSLVVWHWKRRRGIDSPLVLNGWTLNTNSASAAKAEMERIVANTQQAECVD